MTKFKCWLRIFTCIVYFMCFTVTCTYRSPPYLMPFYGKGKFILFKDLNSILQHFEEQKTDFPDEVQTVLNAFHECFFTADIPRSTGLRRPFVAIEGKNRMLRETIARMLADTMGARYLCTPPRCLTQLVHIFQKGSLIRNAFFALSLYPSAFNARQLLAIGTPVIMNGYWTEQASYVIDKLYRRTRDLPPIGSWIYDHPRDLMMPDILFYIKDGTGPAGDQYFTTRTPNWKPKILQIYANFREVPVVVVDMAEGAQRTVDYMYDRMRERLGDEFDFSPAIPYEIGEI